MSSTKEHIPTVFIVTGERRGGKTTFLTDLVERLNEMNFSADGILAIASSGEEMPASYTMKHITTGKLTPICDRNEVADWERIGPFYFNPAAIDTGNAILTNPEILNSDLVIIDEIGKFEIDGMIWANSVSWLLSKSTCPLILSVRDTFTDQVIEKWGLQDVQIIDIQKSTPDKASETIIKRIRINKP